MALDRHSWGLPAARLNDCSALKRVTLLAPVTVDVFVLMSTLLSLEPEGDCLEAISVAASLKGCSAVLTEQSNLSRVATKGAC